MPVVVKVLPEVACEIYRRFHSGEALDQRSLAREYKTSKGTTNNIILARGRFSVLKEQFPDLQRSTKPIKVIKPVKPKRVPPVKVVTKENQLPDNDNESVVELAEQALDALPRLSPEAAVFFSRFAYYELADCLRMLQRPDPRLDRWFASRGRPKNKDPRKESVELNEDTELAVRERKSEEFLETKV